MTFPGSLHSLIRACGAVCLTALPLLLSCGHAAVTETEMLAQAELFGTRASFMWQNTDVFQIRGNCRLEDASLVARGPFVLWGSAPDTLLRGDFYGPDGGPVVSLRADPTGMTLYFPEEGSALFTPIGLRTGDAVLPTIDLIHMLRTGFPMLLEPWMISDGAIASEGSVHWNFTSIDESTLMTLTLQNGSLFPSVCFWSGGELRITAASSHDEYNAWPWKWETEIDGSTVELELTHVNAEAVPWEGIWNLTIPLPVDTIAAAAPWTPVWHIEVR